MFVNRHGRLRTSFGHPGEILSVTDQYQLMIGELRRRNFVENTIHS